MSELLWAVTGAVLLIVGAAWRWRAHRSGGPELRARLTDPDPGVRAEAIRSLDDAGVVDTPVLIGLAGRDRAPEVRSALATIAFGSEPAATGASRLELRRKVSAPPPGAGSPPAPDSLLAAIEAALGCEVTELRVRAGSRTTIVKAKEEHHDR